jgi:hypothetical protein
MRFLSPRGQPGAGQSAMLPPSVGDVVSSTSDRDGEAVMKFIASVLIATTIVIGLVAPASAALDAKTFWDQHERNLP